MWALALWGWCLNFGFSTTCVWYLALSNKNTDLSGQKQKKPFGLRHTHMPFISPSPVPLPPSHCGFQGRPSTSPSGALSLPRAWFHLPLGLILPVLPLSTCSDDDSVGAYPSLWLLLLVGQHSADLPYVDEVHLAWSCQRGQALLGFGS